MIDYQGKDYETREITVCPEDMAYTVLVAKRELWEMIKHDVYDLSPKETAIDDSIAYYCNEEEWDMNDEQLAKVIQNL